MARRPTDAHAMIERIDISAFSIPTDAPESDGTCEWISSTLALVEAHVGAECELSYTYADAATAWLIHDQFVHLVVGLDASAVSRGGSKWPARRAVRSEGQAVKSAVVFVAGRGPRLRIGLWHVDFTSYSLERLRKQLGGWAARGGWPDAELLKRADADRYAI
jgi:hypothetical protein